MSRSFALERIRINVEIACEQMGDFLGSSFGALKKPLTMLAGLALIMTLRSARRGVKSMKGLTVGGHDTTYKAYKAPSYGAGSTYGAGSAYGAGSTYGAGSSSGVSSGLSSASSLRSSSTPGYGGGGGATRNTGGYGSSGYGSTSTTTAATYGTTGGAASQYNSGSTTGAYSGASSYGNTASSMYGGGGGAQQQQPPRPLADLLDRHGAALRVMDAQLFKDYGGVHEFYGMVETLQAYEGAGVVDKVLQSPGQNKVLVVDGGANLNVGVYGKVAAQAARQNGWKGVIIHGAIRDTKAILETTIGCKAMGTNPNRGRATSGSKGSALNIAGMQITSGMWVYADKDGIAFSDAELTAGATGMAPQGGGAGVGSGLGVGMGGGTQVGGYSSPGGGTAAYGGGQQQQATSTYGNSGGTGGSQVGAYGGAGAGANPGYGSQMGGAITGAYGSQGGYGGGSTTGTGTYSGAQQQGAYGQQATSSTYGASRPGTSGYPGGSATSNANPYSHAAARKMSASSREVGVSIAVYLSLLSLLIVPLEFI